MSNLLKSPIEDSEIESADSDTDVPKKQPSRKLMIGIFAALVLWILSIALGTMLFGEVDDWRKPVFVTLPMGLFLCVWALLLRRKHLLADD